MHKKKKNLKISILQFLVCLTISSVHALELKVDNPNYIPPEFGGVVYSGCYHGTKEIEYEANFGVIDTQVYKSNECQLNINLVPWKRLMVGVDIFYDFDREYELKFGPLSDRYGEPNYQSSSSGFLDPDVILAYEFRSVKDSWNQQIYFKMNPFDIEEKPRKIYRGGHDILLAYRFAHSYEEDVMYGSLFTHYYGKKDFFQPGASRKSVIEAYTEVGLRLGYIYRLNDKWSFQVEGLFGLSSDYDVVTPEITKTADKGFLIGGKIGVNYMLNQDWGVQLKHIRSSRIYNATNEDRTQEIDYELEDKVNYIGVIYKWDSTAFFKGLFQ